MPELEEQVAEPSAIALNFFKDMKGNAPPPGSEIKKEETKEPAKEDEQDDIEKRAREDKQKEDGLILQREKREKPIKATPDQSLATLRKQRDELAEKHKGFSELFGDNPPQVIKPIYDIVAEIANGPITETTVKEFVEEYKTYKDRVSELESKLAEKEKVITETDIRYSEEFNNNFDQPYKAAAQELFLEFANIQGDAVIAPAATKTFNDFLIANPDSNGVTVKGELAKFVKAYKAESGEEPIVPSVTNIMNALRGFKDKAVKLKNAYENWAVTKKESAAKRMADDLVRKEQTDKALSAKRKELAGKAFREFDLDDTPFVTNEEVEAFVREEFQFGEDIRDGKVPEYDEFIKRGVEARLWKKYSKELNELREFKELHEKGERNDLTGQDRIDSIKSKDGKVDWLTMR